MKRKDYAKKRAQYLKKRARKFAGHSAPLSIPMDRPRPHQPLIHSGHVTPAQLRAIAAVTENQL